MITKILYIKDLFKLDSIIINMINKFRIINGINTLQERVNNHKNIKIQILSKH